MKNSIPKWVYTVIPLLIVVVLLACGLTMALSNNILPIVDMSNFTPQFSPSKYYVKIPNKNPDDTITLSLTLSKLESVDQKQSLFKNYTALHLKPAYFDGTNFTYGPDAYEVDLPDNLASSLPLNNQSFYPAQFSNMVDKTISLQVTVKKLKLNYSVYDVVSWSLLYVN